MMNVNGLMDLDKLSSTFEGRTARTRLMRESGCAGKKFEVFGENGVERENVLHFGRLGPLYDANGDAVAIVLDYYVSVSGRKVPLNEMKSIDVQNRRIQI